MPLRSVELSVRIACCISLGRLHTYTKTVDSVEGARRLRCNLRSANCIPRSVSTINHPYGWNELHKLKTDRYNAGVLDNSPKINKIQRGKIQDFCPRDIESCHLATARCVKLWSLINSNLFFKQPHQLTCSGNRTT